MTSPSPTSPETDWPADVAARIDVVVGTARDRVTVPVMTAARFIVYGVVLGSFTVGISILMVIALVRLCDVYLPVHPVPRRVWVVDFAASAIFLALGAFFWRKGRPRSV